MPEKTVKRRLQNAGDAAFDIVLQRQNRPEKLGVNPHTCGSPNQFGCSLSQEGIGSI
jgi:hypothetical protein